MHTNTHTHIDILLENVAYIQYLKCHFLNIKAVLLARFITTGLEAQENLN